MSPRLLLLSTLVVPMLVGCGDHSSSRGPSATETRHASARASQRARALPRVVAVRQAAWHLPYPVARAALIGAGGRSVILAGGLLDGDVSTGQVTRIDLTHGRTKALPPLAVPVHDTAGGLVGGVPTVVGGGNSTEQSQVQALVHGRWVGVGNLPTTRSDLEVVEWRRHAYVIGGYDGSSVPRAILRLQRGAPARPVGDLLRGVRYAAVARIGSEVYVFGGEVAGRELDTVQRVDLATGHVSQAGRLPIPLGHGMAAAVGSRILLMGGRDSPEHQTDALWWFDPATHRFRKAGRLPFPLSDAAAASYGRRVWLLGGETPGVTDRVVTVTLR